MGATTVSEGVVAEEKAVTDILKHHPTKQRHKKKKANAYYDTSIGSPPKS